MLIADLLMAEEEGGWDQVIKEACGPTTLQH